MQQVISGWKDTAFSYGHQKTFAGFECTFISNEGVRESMWCVPALA